VPAVKQGGLMPRMKRDAAGAAGPVGLQPTGLNRGAGLAVRLSSSGQRRGGVWTCEFLLSILGSRPRTTVTFPRVIRGNPPVGAEHRAYTLVFGGL
jgi:hypothetical protein